MTITVYSSEDASAPAIAASAGSLISLLDACLVNGYGSKAAAGWSKVYTGTNVAVYRSPVQSPASYDYPYLQVMDTSTTETQFRGYTTMSDATTGTDEFPLISDYPTPPRVPKGTNHKWFVIAMEEGFYFWTQGSSSYTVNGTTQRAVFFGRFSSYLPEDRYPWILAGSFGSVTGGNDTFGGFVADGSTGGTSGHYFWRSYRGDYFNIGMKYGMGSTAGSSAPTCPMGPGCAKGFPNPISGGYEIMPVEMAEYAYYGQASAGSWPRGIFPGMYISYASTPFKSFTVFDGTGEYVGRKFIQLPTAASSITGYFWVDVTPTGDWYA